jgi:hypothetical protein
MMTTTTTKFDNEDDVSEMLLCEKLHSINECQQENDKSYLFEKFLNSNENFDTLSMKSSSQYSHMSSTTSTNDFTIPTKVLKQLESQMLHSDLRRESFRARAGTSNFCMNPLFEEEIANENIEFRNSSREMNSSSRNSNCSMDEIRVNCVEEILVGLCKIRKSPSIISNNSEKSSFVVERCHSLKRNERKLK